VNIRSFKLVVAALGGQGGGVLTNWLIEVAERERYLVQTTSVPGVAQRTGATLYYLELFPRAEAERVGREPVMALMPVSGDVDCVLAAELVEAGRALQRGLVHPERTVLIASSHRAYTISEKSALGSGAIDTDQLIELARTQAKRLVLLDMAEIAERHHSVISSVLLGALAGSRALPFTKESFATAIQRSGIAVKENLAAFEDAYAQATSASSPPAARPPASKLSREIPERACSPRLQPLLDRVRALPPAAQPVVLEGVRRLTDYQDPAYAEVYLQRLEKILALDNAAGGERRAWALLQAAAQSLALWMSFEDTIRVADLKTRGERFARVRSEVRAAPAQIVAITEFMKPRVAEITGTLPVALGAWIRRSPRRSSWLARFTQGREVRTTTISGYLTLRAIAKMKRWRRRTLRFQEESERIASWLHAVEQLAANSQYDLAVELVRAQRLVKGYGDTHERGWRNFQRISAQVAVLRGLPGGAEILARLVKAALADEHGTQLERSLRELVAAPAPHIEQPVPQQAVLSQQ
jgi:indolepyruvate ferredoxin oxidoreductase beta subunit